MRDLLVTGNGSTLLLPAVACAAGSGNCQSLEVDQCIERVFGSQRKSIPPRHGEKPADCGASEARMKQDIVAISYAVISDNVSINQLNIPKYQLRSVQ